MSADQPTSPSPPIAVLGLGNVLMGDDALGPYVIRLLEARFVMDAGVELVDAGTPGLDLAPHLAGRRAVTIVDTIRVDAPPGTLRTYDRQQLLRHPPGDRVSPHDPGLKETLLTLEFQDQGPETVLLVGVVPASVETHLGLSEPVRAALEPAIAAVLAELDRLGHPAVPRPIPERPDLWWERTPGRGGAR